MPTAPTLLMETFDLSAVRGELADHARIRAGKRRTKEAQADDMHAKPDVNLWEQQLDALVEEDVYDITIVYLRVSTAHQSENYGPDVQRRHAFGWVVAKQTSGDVSERGVDILVWDVDSGREESREGFEFVRRAVATSRVKYVVAYRYDRFARNQYYSELIHREFRPKRATLVSATEDLPSGPLGELMRQIIQALGQYEAALIAERLTRGKKEAVRQNGTYYGGMAPFGYLAQSVAENGAGILKVCEPEARIVRLIFALYERGYTPYAISDFLNDSRIPRRNMQQTWSQGNVNRILHREAAYRAEALFGSLNTDVERPAQDAILPHRPNALDRTYLWGTAPQMKGWRVPADGLDGQPVPPPPRKNSRHNLTAGQARTLLALYGYLDAGLTREEAARKLADEGLTTLKGAPWGASTIGRYVDYRIDFEVAAKATLGDAAKSENDGPALDHRMAVERERAAIRRILDLKKHGWGIRKIMNKVNDEGHTTLAGNRWYPSTIESVLKGKAKASDRYAK